MAEEVYVVQLGFSFRVISSTNLDAGGAFTQTPYHLVTHGQQMGMRKVFPCFDEPRFKATFRVTVDVAHDRHPVWHGMVMVDVPSPPISSPPCR